MSSVMTIILHFNCDLLKTALKANPLTHLLKYVLGRNVYDTSQRRFQAVLYLLEIHPNLVLLYTRR